MPIYTTNAHRRPATLSPADRARIRAYVLAEHQLEELHRETKAEALAELRGIEAANNPVRCALLRHIKMHGATSPTGIRVALERHGFQLRGGSTLERGTERIAGGLSYELAAILSTAIASHELTLHMDRGQEPLLGTGPTFPHHNRLI